MAYLVAEPAKCFKERSKKENLDGNQVRLISCGILPTSSPVVGAFPGFPGRFVPGFLCFFVVVAPNPRILCT